MHIQVDRELLMVYFRDGRVPVQSTRNDGKHIKKMIAIIKHILYYAKPILSVLIICGKWGILLNPADEVG